MFCGIVDHTGIIKSIEQKPKGLLFRIQTQFTDFSLGESISVDGACLTVVDSQNDTFDCELSPETVQLTIAKSYQVGQRVNLERAMRLNDRIGGHLITGHVDETILVKDRIKHEDFIEIHFSDFPKARHSFLIKKGSVTINGVSLTVNTVEVDRFSVMLIPHTLKKTNLSDLVSGQRVNVEWDYMAKLVVNHMKLVRESRPIGSGIEEE